VTERTYIRCERPFATSTHFVCLPGAARWPLFSPPACDHGAPRRSPQKPRVVDRGHISTGEYSRCAGKAIRGPDLRWSASLNRHKIWPDYKNGLKKGGWAGLKALCQRMRCYSACRILHLELRPRPMGREHARPQPPAGSRRQPPVRRRGRGASPGAGRGHRPRTEPSGGQVGPPGPHPTQLSSSLDPARGRAGANNSPPGPWPLWSCL
jgi:hypothetical protein